MTVTPLKAAANRANAQKSTGPRTQAGKNVSRLNGVRHGLRAEFVVVPQLEDPNEWEAHRAAIAEVLAPQNYLEELFADRAALATWRLRRAARCERGILAQAQAEAEKVAGESLRLSNCLRWDLPIRTLAAATKEARHYRAAIALLEQLDEVKADPESSLENEVLFNAVLQHAAEVAGIALKRREEDGKHWEELPASVYARAEAMRDYWPTLGELRDGFAAIAAHSSGATREEIVDEGLGWLRELAERAKEQEATFAAAVEREREKNALPIGLADGGDVRHDELIARYETAAEKTLQRAIEGIRALRALGSVGKNGAPGA